MRYRWMAWGGLGFVAGLILVEWMQAPLATAQFSPAASGSESADLIVQQGLGPDGWQHILVIDSSTRVMASYQINPTSGAIGLKSVRKIAYDLMLEDFNGGEPSSQQIQQMIDHR